MLAISDPIVVVGAGQAGAALAAKLRALGYDGELVIIGEEPVAPYQRPPLSKKYVSGELAFDRLLIRPLEWYAQQRIDLHLGVRVVAICPADHLISFADGAKLRYAKLAITTGATPRTLSAQIGGDLGGVFCIRNLADADAIAPELIPGRNLVVVGGGYIGLEAAAVAATKGMRVTLLEAADRILQRVAAEETSEYFRDLHRRHGVIVRERAQVEQFCGEAARVTSVLLRDGTTIATDLVIVGIGITPNDHLAKAAGLEVNEGIVVDEFGRTTHRDIFAAGDCSNVPWRGIRTRLESVQNAIEQAEHAALTMLGFPRAYDPVPWFWSDQYDVKLQIAGLNRGYDNLVVRAGKRPGSKSMWYYREGALLAVDAMNDALAYAFAKKALENGKTIDPAIAADPFSDLKTSII